MRSDDVLIRRSQVVRVHLDILEALLAETPSESQAIRASMSLRFFMDGALNQVANELGQTLTVPAPDLTGVPLDQAFAFACGGYVLGGVQVSPYYLYRESGPNSPHRRQYEEQVASSPREHALAEVKLGTFFQLPSMAVIGRSFSREQVVRYVANKCGGAHHHDQTRAFGDLEHGLTTVGHVLQVDGRGLSAVFLETVGTAWFLINAPTVLELRAALAGRLNGDEA